MVKDRIIEYLNYKGVSITRAEVELGWSKGALLKANSISSDRLGEFTLHFKDVNLDWLITGTSEMLKTAIPAPSVSNTVHGDVEGGFVGSGVLHNGNVIGDGNNVGIIPADYEKKLIRAQVEIDYLKKENKTLKDQLKQAMADKDKAMSMLDKALNK